MRIASMMTRDRLSSAFRSTLARVGFALASTAVVVVFSEKMYWHVTGYGIADLLVGYFMPTFAFLTIVDFFRIRHLAPLFLAAAVFGFLTEGALVPIIYEGGPFGWFNVTYTPLAWHAPLSIFFGWYLLRLWLVNGQLKHLLAGSVVVGLFWGLWALAWWLPENVNDAELLAAGAQLGQWPIWQFAAHAFVFTGVVFFGHRLFGRGAWLAQFRPSRIELALVTLGLLFFFVFQVLLIYPWAPLKLGVVLATALVPLAIYRREQPDQSLLAELVGPVRLRDALGIFAMPTVAVAVYAIATVVNPSTDVIYAITSIGLVLGSAVAGLIIFAMAIAFTVRGPLRARKHRQVETV